MHSSIVIIGCYFGKLPPYFDLWCRSAEENPTIDWLVFTDDFCRIVPNNVRIIPITLSALREEFSKILGFPVSLCYPYKLCDFKVAYGLLFKDYISDYSFWGYCDFDMIFGNLRRFFTEDILAQYDRVFDLGHLSIYRNLEEVNQRFMNHGSLRDYHTVFTQDEHFALDEDGGINRIYNNNNYPYYNKRIFADISSIYNRFRLIRKQNFKNQIFYWYRGSIYRYYKDSKGNSTEEYPYIHFKKRKFKFEIDNISFSDDNGVLIYPNGFLLFDYPSTNLDELFIYNRHPGYILESFECAFYYINLYFHRVRKKLGK